MQCAAFSVLFALQYSVQCAVSNVQYYLGSVAISWERAEGDVGLGSFQVEGK